MATYTTNLDLKKPAQNDKIRIADINGNMDDIDAAFGAVGETSVATQLGDIREGMAIVSNGDVHGAIAAGQFVYVMNHSTLDDGLYTADSALAANASLTSSNVTAVSGGGLNALNSKCKFGKYSSVTLPFEATTDGYLYLWLNPSSTSGAYARVAFTSDGATISGGLNAKAGDGVSLFVPVPKGCYVSQSALSGGSLTTRFCPVFE